MQCTKCGYQLNGTEATCPSCGIKLKKLDPKKVIVLSLLSVVILLLGISAIVLARDDGKNHGGSNTLDGSRTIMIYMVGSNLESVSKIATSELESIDPGSINLDRTNILLYTGGTKKWHNFISNDENAIYILKKDGFEKLESYDKHNMGDYKTLLEFLDYSYSNYKADYFDLVFYNHGGAIDGAIYDDFTEDNLSLDDFSKALKESKFNENNKLNTVLFRTCLNGTLEVASVFAPYANYLIASEEVTNGRGDLSVLNYINDIEPNDNAVSYGKKFIEAYQKQIDIIDPFKFYTFSTYSILDLSKIDNVIKELNSFVSTIDVKNNYNNIVKMRSSMYQYAYTTYNDSSYDMVDLYTLVNNLSKFTKTDNSKLLKAMDDAIVYNWSDDNTSNGISIYFPYKRSKDAKTYFLKVYKNLGFEDYYSFINKFNSLNTSGGSTSFAKTDITDSKTEITNDRNFTLQLSDEQVKDYASSIYMVFKKNNDKYYPLYSSDNTELTKDGMLKTNIGNNLIKAYDDETPNGDYLLVVERKRQDKSIKFNTVILQSYEGEISDWKMDSANAYFEEVDGKVQIGSFVSIDSKNGASGTVLNPDEYKSVAFIRSGYKILDADGNYTDNWDNEGTVEGFEYDLDKVYYKYQSLDDEDDYYCVFKIVDIYGNIYYSKLLNIN